jgi:hypothetical protein
VRRSGRTIRWFCCVFSAEPLLGGDRPRRPVDDLADRVNIAGGLAFRDRLLGVLSRPDRPQAAPDRQRDAASLIETNVVGDGDDFRVIDHRRHQEAAGLHVGLEALDAVLLRVHSFAWEVQLVDLEKDTVAKLVFLQDLEVDLLRRIARSRP